MAKEGWTARLDYTSHTMVSEVLVTSSVVSTGMAYDWLTGMPLSCSVQITFTQDDQRSEPSHPDHYKISSSMPVGLALTSAI